MSDQPATVELRVKLRSFPRGHLPIYREPTLAEVQQWLAQHEEKLKMPEYRKYRRTAIAEMADWTPGFDMTDVSVSAEDQKAGSPKAGDKIARNPANHADRWLVAAAYAEANFEPLA